MASPVYNTAAFRRHPPFGGYRRRRWGAVLRGGSMLGGTPHYLGTGQPAIENGGELFGDGTPVYLTAPSTTAPSTPSTTPSGPTSPQPTPTAAPPSATTAIV